MGNCNFLKLDVLPIPNDTEYREFCDFLLICNGRRKRALAFTSVLGYNMAGWHEVGYCNSHGRGIAFSRGMFIAPLSFNPLPRNPELQKNRGAGRVNYRITKALRAARTIEL